MQQFLIGAQEGWKGPKNFLTPTLVSNFLIVIWDLSCVYHQVSKCYTCCYNDNFCKDVVYICIRAVVQIKFTSLL